MKRTLDLTIAIFATFLLLLPLGLIALIVKITSNGPVLYWSDRVGRHNRIFKMVKFRSMRVGTPTIATHLLNDPTSYLTPIGSFLRKSSLDELPQLWNIIKGDMSIVGPRPALYNQLDLIEMRTRSGVHLLRPGLTGLAQISGRDELPLEAKIALDIKYSQRMNLRLDLQIIWLTAIKVAQRDNIVH